jgi:hypothetical protein
MTNGFTLLIKVSDSIIFEHLLFEKNIKFQMHPSFLDLQTGYNKYSFETNDRKLIDEICVIEKIKWVPE